MPPITEKVVANPMSILCNGYSRGITEAIIAHGTRTIKKQTQITNTFSSIPSFEDILYNT
jgi:hypothetical protein